MTELHKRLKEMAEGSHFRKKASGWKRVEIKYGWHI